MTPFQSELCWEAQLERMLDDQKPEDAHLDYKGIESLLPSGRGGGGLDKQKRAEDISRDVSSFLNSDGGLLVYGVPESEDPSRTGGSPIPGGPEIGFQRGEATKETIEDLITSNIQPRPGPDLFQVTEVPYCGRIVIVVEVNVGLGDVWQAKDRRYYKRFNYKAEPMDHYEVEMVRNRTMGPNFETGIRAQRPVGNNLVEHRIPCPPWRGGSNPRRYSEHAQLHGRGSVDRARPLPS